MACPVCGEIGATSFPYLDGGWPDLDLFSDLQIEVCQECGFGQASPAPDSKSLADFYRSHYREKSSVYYVDFDRRKKVPGNAGIDFRSLSQLSLATMFCDFQAGDALLDLGPGWGGCVSDGSANSSRSCPVSNRVEFRGRPYVSEAVRC